MSDQVGFSFQADVVNTASMGHVLTGRLLKALSDGGVDTYALWSAVQLGKLIPVQKSLQSTLYAQIASKKTYQSVLSKALSIGWGHSAPVADLARTVAGSNAIILIGALATGCQPFAAAQCLSELMSIHGLEADTLPSVDVLKGLVGYLAPFVQDLGFSKVVQHITNVCERMIRSKRPVGGRTERDTTEEKVQQMKNLGSPATVARAIKQLILTSQKGQSDYMVLEVRGSWLPAFASHILGISVELRLGDQIVWASGGDRGSVCFQLDEDGADSFGYSLSRTGQIIVRREPDDENASPPISVDYLISEALEAQLLTRPETDASIAKSIKGAIADLSFHLFEIARGRQPKRSSHETYPLHFEFDGKSSLEETLTLMGIDIGTLVELAAGQPGYGVRLKNIWTVLPGLDRLDRKAGEVLAFRCHVHSSEPTLLRRLNGGLYQGMDCLCKFIGRVICGFATAALALMCCRFDPAKLRVQEHVLVGDLVTEWTQTLLLSISTQRQRAPLLRASNVSKGSVSKHDLLEHLGRLICADFSPDWLWPDYTLGVSGKLYTIYYACIMTDECYDNLGRMIVIQSGRASVNGAFRNAIVEAGPFNVSWDMAQTTGFPDPVSLASGTFLEPHCRPSETGISMNVALLEEAIFLRWKLMVDTLHTLPVSLLDCISHFCSCWSVPRCGHSTNTPYEVHGDGDVVVSGFRAAEPDPHFSGEIMVYALRSRKLEQVIICGLMYETQKRAGLSLRRGVLQVTACFECCLRLAQRDDYLRCVVMSG